MDLSTDIKLYLGTYCGRILRDVFHHCAFIFLFFIFDYEENLFNWIIFQ